MSDFVSGECRDLAQDAFGVRNKCGGLGAGPQTLQSERPVVEMDSAHRPDQLPRVRLASQFMRFDYAIRSGSEGNTHRIICGKAGLAEDGNVPQACRDLIRRGIEKASSVDNASDVVEEIQISCRGQIAQGVSYSLMSGEEATPC